MRINVQRSRRRIIVPLLIVGLLVGGFPLFVQNNKTTEAADARQFNAGNIISDFVMTNKNSMSESTIQNFLKSKNHCNDTNIGKASQYPGYNYNIKDGRFVCMADERFDGESAARIIWQAAQDYNINPQVLIVLLQKEQGLVTDTWPNHVQYRGATGYGCPDNADCSAEYYGFKNQVRNAARFFRAYQDNNPGWYKPYWTGAHDIFWNPNRSCGTSRVNIENRATASLYSYTPYRPNQAALNAQYGTGDGCSSYGNRNFWLYFTDWFGSTQEVPVRGLTSKATNSLSSGSSLKPGEFIVSPNGRFIMIMQHSGQLIIYRSGQTVWQSGAVNWEQENSFLSFQADGNLVIYKNGSPLWASDTDNKGGTRLSLQDDGNLVLYTTTGKPIWASDTDSSSSSLKHMGNSISSTARLNVGEYLRSPDWRYFLLMQSDGNLVLYTAGHTQAIWSSGTDGKGGKYVSMQSDGNLVMYGDRGAVWASGTDKGPANLNLQSDGNLVLYRTITQAIWSSGTDGKGGKYVSMQSDGNLVMYGDRGAVWASGTDGKGGKYVSMQSDGNLVMYGDRGAVWASGTDGRKSSVKFSCAKTDRIGNGDRLSNGESLCSGDSLYQLLMQTDGNLVLYTRYISSTWAADSNGKFFRSDLRL